MKGKQRKRLNSLRDHRAIKREIIRELKRPLREHLEAMEYAQWFGSYTTKRTTMGIIPYIRSIQNDQNLRSSKRS